MPQTRKAPARPDRGCSEGPTTYSRSRARTRHLTSASLIPLPTKKGSPALRPTYHHSDTAIRNGRNHACSATLRRLDAATRIIDQLAIPAALVILHPNRARDTPVECLEDALSG